MFSFVTETLMLGVLSVYPSVSISVAQSELLWETIMGDAFFSVSRTKQPNVFRSKRCSGYQRRFVSRCVLYPQLDEMVDVHLCG